MEVGAGYVLGCGSVRPSALLEYHRVPRREDDIAAQTYLGSNSLRGSTKQMDDRPRASAGDVSLLRAAYCLLRTAYASSLSCDGTIAVVSSKAGIPVFLIQFG